MRTWAMARWVLALLAGAALLAGCGRAAQPATSGGPAQTVDVVMAGMRYQPAEIRVRAGAPVTLNLQNRDSVLHDLNVDRIRVTGKRAEGGGHGAHGAKEPDLHVAVPAGGTARLAFTPLDAGQYEVYCAVPGHRQAGMVGKLVVE